MMKQQYVLLKEKNDSLNSLIGQSFNEKSKFEAQKILTEIHKGYFSSWAKALVYNVDPKTNEILGVGGSSLLYDRKSKRIISDLINNNIGELMRGLFHSVFDGTNGVNMTVINGVVDFVSIYAASTPFNRTQGSKIKIGSGATITRSDFDITTPFLNSPEDTLIQTPVTSTYNPIPGTITGITGTFAPTGGSGIIAETVLLSGFTAGASNLNFMNTHDLITPTVSFGTGNTVVVTYSWQL